MQLDIVIPCFNEEEVIRDTHTRVRNVLEEIKDKEILEEFNIIYIDDGSTDLTFEILDELSREEEFVKVISFSKNFGHQAALSAGLRIAEGDAVVTLDADLQDPPELIEKMVNHYHKGFEVVYGIRNDRGGDSFFKRITANAFYKLMQWLGAPIIPNHAEFRLVTRQVLQAFKNYGEVNMFLRGLFPMIGFKYCTLKYKRDKRFAGKTKYSLGSMLKFGFEGITSFSVLPLRIAFVIGMLVCLFSLIASAWSFLTHFLGNSVPGWTSTVLAIYFLGGVQLVFLGLIGEYIGKIYLEVKKRPHYIVRKTRNIEKKS